MTGKTSTSSRATATGILEIVPVYDDGRRETVLRVEREYHYAGTLNSNSSAAQRVEVLNTRVISMDDYGEAWQLVFDLASAVEAAMPLRKVWIVRAAYDVPERIAGAVEMLVRSIAVELGFEVQEVPGQRGQLALQL